MVECFGSEDQDEEIVLVIGVIFGGRDILGGKGLLGGGNILGGEDVLGGEDILGGGVFG